MNALVAAMVLSAAPFDSKAAWAEFEEMVRVGYAYSQRDGVDGAKILETFKARALATKKKEEFVDVAQMIARNFADPHFIVGPLGPEDPNVVPTSSDLYVERIGEAWIVRAVRFDSPAAKAGITSGTQVVSIDGEKLDARIVRLLGQPLTQLSEAQQNFGANVALTGIRNGKPRVLVTGTGSVTLGPSNQQAGALEKGPHLTVRREGNLGVVVFNNSLGAKEVVREFSDALTQLQDASALVLDFRETPSGGNTVVARGIMGHFVDRERPYQMHTIPADEREYGVPRKFIEYVMPIMPRWNKPVFVVGGRWTGSMGEGLMIGFDAIGVITVGSELGHLLGGISNETLEKSGAKLDVGIEALFHVDGSPREAFRPKRFLPVAERTEKTDPALELIRAEVARTIK
ncbi:MAG: S41 family peptidase [Archangium sp.]